MGDLLLDGLWWAEMKGRAVLGMSDLTVRETLAGEDPGIFDLGLTPAL